jgi:FAD/FMN-containing dehydrogenase
LDLQLPILLEPYLYDCVAEHKGSISAEHGLGFKKRNFIYHSKTESAVRVMRVAIQSLVQAMLMVMVWMI